MRFLLPWSAPKLAFSADLLDDERIAPGTGKHGSTPWSEVYGMAATRHGDQYLGMPWVFDLAFSPNRDNGDPGPDTGRSHIEIAASRDLVNWSRPDRTTSSRRARPASGTTASRSPVPRC